MTQIHEKESKYAVYQNVSDGLVDQKAVLPAQSLVQKYWSRKVSRGVKYHVLALGRKCNFDPESYLDQKCALEMLENGSKLHWEFITGYLTLRRQEKIKKN